jgi:Transmembrane exosortase (Exosortase_EpsH)
LNENTVNSVFAIPSSKSSSLSSLHISSLLMLCGCINGLIANIAHSWNEQGLNSASSLFGVGFYFPAIICIAFTRMYYCNQAIEKMTNITLGFSALYFISVLAPSSLVSWLAVGLYGSVLTFQHKKDARIGAILFVALAICAIWTNFGFKAFVVQLTNLDALLIQHILKLMGYAVERSQNVLTQTSGFSVIILADCSTWKGLPLEILSFIAVCLFGGASLQSRRIWIAVILMVPLMIILNLIRLSLISLSPDLHATIHGDIGRSIFDVARVAVIFATAIFIVQ